ncbi:hypothetical protein K1T71_007183 [Dendrolimus kikuchii]|uniref:Uncharacterized protein n=1 Tax=Dendrolimus kikuchii TaxID=765133 RepID=A0ACC1D0D2_9NEOP|nr:hypothetical protein K1T71_007183 [Dendrolimus kikuchii]
MWYLTSDADERIVYIIPQSKDIIIGRSSEAGVCNFSITNDASVSRKHASLTISTNGSSLLLQDFGSTYGTFVNDFSHKVQANSKIQLKNNDVLRFGKLNSVWKVNEKDLTTCTSTLKGENMQNLKIVLNKIGGILKNEWDHSCQYLTMPAITLTIKVVLALVQGSYIVTQEFWNKCLEAVENSKALPDPNNFTPEVIESTLNKESVSFLPDKRRQTLLKGKKILFFSKRQYDMYKGVLSNCSGEPVLITESEVSTSVVCKRDVIVIQYNASSTQDTQTLKNKIDEVVQFLKSNDKRVIADAEIGLAILYTSTDKYCNPDFNFSTEVMKASTQNTKTTKILAPESQEPVIQGGNKNVVINESLISSDNLSGKRKYSADGSDLEMNLNKKQAIDNRSIEIENINKRKFANDGDAEISNPSKKLATSSKSDDDMFNFLEPVTSNDTQNKGKKLNLSKPQKRKVDFDGNEDDLFNFLQDEKSSETTALKHKMFDTDINEEPSRPVKIENKGNEITPQEISAMRGVKLKELQSNLNCNFDAMKKQIKKEYDDLDDKMKELDLGITVVTVNKDLIVKKEPVYIEAPISELKNFKKFRKVWPTKKQVTVIPKSSTSAVMIADNFEINSACYDNIEDQS